MGGGKSILIFVFVFILLISFSLVSAVTNITQCGNITSPGIYELNTSLQAGDEDSCLMINASDVILDCVDYSYSINGTYSSNTSGVGVLDYLGSQALTNITIKNCNITGFDVGLLYSNNTNNSIIFNNSLYNNTYGIVLEQTYNVNISKNSITAFSSNSSAILLSEDNSSIIENNNITTNGVFGFGITVFDYSSGTLVNLNTITTSNTNASAIIIDDGSFSINLTANTITTLGNMGWGIAFFSSPGSNLLYNNTITTSGSESFGIFLESGSDYNISSNIITTSGYRADGVNLQEDSNNSAFTQNIIQTEHSEACVIHIEMLGNNNAFYDNIFNTSSQHLGVCLDDSPQPNNWNTTRTEATNIIGNNWTGGNFWTNNASTGYSDICIDSDGDYICDNAILLGDDNIDYLPLTNHTNMFSGCGTLDIENKSYYLNQSLAAINGTCFNITANNVTVNLQGKNITGNGTGYGINITGYNDTAIVGGGVSNFSNGIYISSGSNNAFTNIIINNSAQDAILLEGATSSDNNFTNVIATNTNSSYYDINFSTAGINGTWIINIYFRNYTFAGAGGLVNFKEPSFGEIRFLEPINGSGTSLYTDVDIESNSAFVNPSSNQGLNKSANIILYGITYTDPKPQYSSDNSVWTDCAANTNPACVELSFSGNEFMFNVTHFTYFRAAEAYVAPTSLTGAGGNYPVYVVSDKELAEGYTNTLMKNWRMKFKIGGEYHYLKLIDLTNTIATIEISSEIQQANLSVNESKKFDITGDGYYDFYVMLNNIMDNKATLTIQSIHEEIGEEEAGEGGIPIVEMAKSLLWLWILIGAIILAIGVWIIISRKKR